MVASLNRVVALAAACVMAGVGAPVARRRRAHRAANMT